MSEPFKRALLLLFPFMGCCFLTGGLMYRRHLKRRVNGFAHTYGSVVSHKDYPFATDGPAYIPVVEFTVGRKVYSIEGSVGSSFKKEAGSKVEVMYDPASPITAYLVRDYYFAVNIICLLGGVFLGFGALLAKVLWDAPPGGADELSY